MNKEALIQAIYQSFDGVTLEDGIGLWEAQGIDDYLSKDECKKLREKDEKDDWRKIPLTDLYRCNSSLPFFDAKGFRFHLPICLLIDLGAFADHLHDYDDPPSYYDPPDIAFHLCFITKYLNKADKHAKGMVELQKQQFSLLDTKQTEVVIAYLEYKLEKVKEEHLKDYEKFGMAEPLFESDKECKVLTKAVSYWKSKLENLASLPKTAK